MSTTPHAIPTGIVYLAGNVSMPGFYKIGYTSRNVDCRMVELSRSTSVPTAFYALTSVITSHPAIVERQVHEELFADRAGKEFFKLHDDRNAFRVFTETLCRCPAFYPLVEGAPVPAEMQQHSEPPKPHRRRPTPEEVRGYFDKMRALLNASNGGEL